MPNWCENETYLYHRDPAMLLRARDAFVEGRLLDEFVPVPDSLKIVAGRVSDPDEQKTLEEQTELNRKTHGYGNWYDWCIAHWGTKWDVEGDAAAAAPGASFGALGAAEPFFVFYELDATTYQLYLHFDSAWSPPIEAYRAMEKTHGFTITSKYSEYGMGFRGTYADGIENTEDIPESEYEEIEYHDHAISAPENN